MSIEDLHRRVDKRAAELVRRHAARLRCARGCADCCVDGLTVFPVEAERIRHNCRELLRNGEPHPPGRCAFLGADLECRIYPHRPYVCRTQGLPLRWLEEDRSGELVELRDICPLNEEGPPLEELPAQDCWSIGPVEEELARLAHCSRARIPLRDLFENYQFRESHK